MRIVVAYGSDGEFSFNAVTGGIVRADPGYAHVTRVDVEEWSAYYGGRPLPDVIDVLDLAYWHVGGYEPAVADYRASLSEARSDNNG